MPLDSAPLQEFYESRTGQTACRLIGRRLREQWPDLARQRVLGMGYAPPYLRLFPEAERTLAAVPSEDMARGKALGSGRLSLVEETALPFRDASFDCALVIHGLEVAETPRTFLRELWRVLTPEGRLLLAVPNRASLWAWFETTPFGHGQPFSRHQLRRLLEQSLFVPESWTPALCAPPFGRYRSANSGQWLERIGMRLWPGLAGVHIVAATKSMYVPIPAKEMRRSVLQPAYSNSSSSRTAKIAHPQFNTDTPERFR